MSEKNGHDRDWLQEYIDKLPRTDEPEYAEHRRLVEYLQIQKPDKPNLRPNRCPVCGGTILSLASSDETISDDGDMTVKAFTHGCGTVISYVSEYKR